MPRIFLGPATAPLVRPAAAIVMTLLVVSAGSARAQDVGARAGVSGSPDQFYVGVHAETTDVAERLRFRPNVEIGVGGDATLVALNFEFVYRVPLNRRIWNLYVGGGPALNIVRAKHDTRPEGGFNILIGAAHPRGLFTELKVGALHSPSVKVGIGTVFR